MARQSMRERLRDEAAKSTTEGASYLKLPSGAKVSFFSPEDAEYELDVIPFENDKDDHHKGYEKGDLVPYVRYKLHQNIGAENGKFVCPTSVGKPCPICEERVRLSKKRDADYSLVKALTPKDRTLFNIIDLKDKKNDGIQLWDYSYHLFAKRLLGDIDKTENGASTRRRSTPHAGFAELEDGQTLFVSFIEKKMAGEGGKVNKFYECDRIDAEDRDAYKDDILDEALNLDDLLKVLPYDELETIFLELDAAGKKPEKPEEEEGRSSRRSRGENKDEKEPAPSRERGSRRGAEKEEPKEESTGRRARRGAEKEEPKEEPKQEESGRSSRPRRGEQPAKETPECIAKGGVFGEDCNKHDKCYDCADDIYDACAKASGVETT